MAIYYVPSINLMGYGYLNDLGATVNDPELMIEKTAALTAATGMNSLTHAIETIVVLV